MEDNEAVIKILRKGRTLALRHVSKTHRKNIDWIYDACCNEDTLVRYIDTKHQLSDILTKAFSNKKRNQWEHVVQLCGFRVSPHDVTTPDARKPIQPCVLPARGAREHRQRKYIQGTQVASGT